MKQKLILFLAIFLFGTIAYLQAQIITTVAGDSTGGYSGDGGAATAAELNAPYGVAVDASGNLYIADYSNNRIRKVSAATGYISTVAGNGTAGYTGDGGAAAAAELNHPAGVAVDASGNLYIADDVNQRIRKVSAATGYISTVAGNGTQGYSGDGGAATAAELNDPSGLAVDASGNLYIADVFNNRIRKVSAATGYISTVAGNGNSGYSGDGGAATAAELYYPYGVAVDASGNLYIADDFNSRIRKVSAATGYISTVAGNGTQGYSGDGGAATAAELNDPSGLAVDASGNLYIADNGNQRIRKVSAATGYISTVAGNGNNGYSGDGGAATAAELNNPIGVAVDASGNLYIADYGNQRIRKVSAACTTPSLSSQATTAASGAAFSYTPTGTAPGGTTYAWSAPSGSGFSGGASGAGSATLTGTLTNTTSGIVTAAYSVTPTSGTCTGSAFTVSVSVSAPILAPTISLSGGSCIGAASLTAIGAPGGSQMTWYQSGIAVYTVAASSSASTVAGGNGSGSALDQFSTSEAIFVDGSGRLYVADANNNRILEFPAGSTSATNGTVVAGGNGAGSAANQLSYPDGVFLDGSGNIYVADAHNNRIQKFPAGSSSSTNATTVAGGNGSGSAADQLDYPTSVVLDASGNIYVSDQNNYRIQKFPSGSTSSTNGVTVAGGNGSGSGLNQLRPDGVYVDAGGNIYSADYSNQRVLKFPSGSTSATYGTEVVSGYNPNEVFVDALGNIYVSDFFGSTIEMFPPGSTSSTTGTVVAGNGTSGSAATELQYPVAVFVDAAGDVYVSDQGNSRIQKWSYGSTYTPVSAGTYTATYTSGATTSPASSPEVISACGPPTITSFSPASGPIGTTVTITGTNFNTTAANNVVFFGATMATVSAATSTSMTVTVPLGADYQYISETNLGSNLTAYSEKPFVVTLAGAIEFAPQVTAAVGSNPFSVSIGDLDGDGKSDLAVANYGTNTVSVFHNTSTPGAVSFSAQATYTCGASPASLAIGDIDGDGKPDLVSANYQSNTISVLLNNHTTTGTLSFATQVTFATGPYPQTLSIADVDGDGMPDVAVANQQAHTVSILRNTSSVGSASFAGQVTFNVGNQPYALATGDIDGDGKPDLAVTVFSVPNNVTVLHNSSAVGSVSFASPLTYATGTYPEAVSIGDIDGDGKPDLVVANTNPSSVSVLHNNFSTTGTPSFAAQVTYAAGTGPVSVSIGDIDGDGKPDLAITNSYNVSVLHNNYSTVGTPGFASQVTFAAGSTPQGGAIGDIDGDGKPDLAVANFSGNTLSVLLQKGANTWTGALSTDWSTAGNWSIAVPTAGTDGIIPGGLGSYPVVNSGSGGGSVRNLTIQSGASLTVASGNQLQVYGNWSNSGQASVGASGEVYFGGTGSSTLSGNTEFAYLAINDSVIVGPNAADQISVSAQLLLSSGILLTNNKLTLLSTSAQTAMIVGTGRIVGDATIQRYVGGSTGYHHISSPVSGATVAALSGFTISGTNGAQASLAGKEGTLEDYCEPCNTTTSLNNGYYNYTTLSNPLISGLGLTAKITGGSTISFYGPPTLVSLNYNITKNGPNATTAGWNFIGNPYPSPISWTDLKSANSGVMNGTCYIWNPTGATAGSWQAYNGGTGVGSATDVIALGQGFFILKTNTGSTALSFTNVIRQLTLNPPFYKTNTMPDEVRLTLTSATESAEAVAYTEAGRSTGFDPDVDGLLPPVMGENMEATSVAFASEGQDYIIHVIDAVNDNTVMPLTIHTATPGTYTLSASALNVNGPAYLLDNTTGKYYDLSSESATIQSTGSQDNNNYSVVFKKATDGTSAASVNIWGTEGNINITRSMNTPAGIIVTDIIGQEITTTTTTNSSVTIPVQTSGVYLVREQEANGIVTVKKVFVK